MMNVILSIKPQFVEEIMAGRKRFEFRKKGFKRQVRKVYIYASSPVCKIVGEFDLGEVIEGEPSDIWRQTKDYSGISKTFFDEYFNNRQIGFALEIKRFKQYSIPIDPYSLIFGFHAPQSFCYTESNL